MKEILDKIRKLKRNIEAFEREIELDEEELQKSMDKKGKVQLELSKEIDEYYTIVNKMDNIEMKRSILDNL